MLPVAELGTLILLI